MDIVYYRHPEGNFGDDLNAVLWRSILPQAIIDAPQTILVGIGSILDQSKFRGIDLSGKDVFVLGSGAAYGALPERIGEWRVLAVRGPLTAKLIGNAAASITDSAYLIRLLPRPGQQAVGTAQGVASSILFMPHFESLPGCDWEAVAERAGVEFVNVQWPVDRILEAYSRARLVVTEAMHGAIVADAFRIPWIPLAISPKFSMFKWTDWTMSMELPVRVNKIPAPSGYTQWRHQRDSGVTSGSTTATEEARTAVEQILEDFRSRNAGGGNGQFEATRARPIRRMAKRAVTPILSLFDERMISKTAQAIRTAVAGESFLSKDSILEARMDRLHGCLSLLGTRVMQRAS